jgi:predicted alpha/beta hydrolase family esterase
MKPPTLLFIQGGGNGAHRVDLQLVNSLQQYLADQFTIIYPEMPNEDDPDYNLWKNVFGRELEKTDGPVILIGHSVGGFLLIKFLSENTVQADIKALFFIAIPFLGDGGWQYEGMFLKDDFANALPQAPLFFYHSMDDAIVPFHHLALYAQQLPGAAIREIAHGGHQLNNDLSAVVADIKGLSVQQ